MAHQFPILETPIEVQDTACCDEDIFDHVTFNIQHHVESREDQLMSPSSMTIFYFISVEMCLNEIPDVKLTINPQSYVKGT